ncbi:MAG: B12-binding domain-containing radical SAM protein [Deltaproteobacteria bacterium]|nr:B12-binding domain-containing radical SAM protein [Deltaproteobacteria bacterium]MBW1748579.1 B12-binding domain-containing radical SAM protein [Deltaproteobacteria bacterium]MBW1969632.1 B12-binding domain-containing radical SAM protein [Deltaproteobacteria bacterium]MBW2156433.1 B12-binding domain-containing radical SAM protein [Deltaproteobacteria bacterium]MDX2496586.1 radical SAM protein [Desulfobacterales bacterium]
MHYEGNIIRPPSEANSILLQITVGCSRNKCTFCGAYKGERFRIKTDSVIMEDIAFASNHCRRQRRVFLCDGDALIVPQKRLMNILMEIEKQLPWVTRVGAYANSKSLKMKTLDELKALKAHGLGILYMGLETGDDVTLKKINKGATSEEMIQMGIKARAAGMKLSITVLLGIAGKKRSQVHARETGRVLSAIDPEYVGALTLMLIPGTPLYEDYKDGEFPLLKPEEMLNELKTMIAATELSKGLFHANHASNYLPIKARLPKDKAVTLRLIDEALAGKISLKPEYFRAL